MLERERESQRDSREILREIEILKERETSQSLRERERESLRERERVSERERD